MAMRILAIFVLLFLSACIQIVPPNPVVISGGSSDIVTGKAVQGKDVVIHTNVAPKVHIPVEPIESVKTPIVVSNVQVTRLTPRDSIIIEIGRSNFDKKKLIVNPGTLVVWQNVDESSHQVSGPGFESKTLGYGDDFRHVFDEPGVYSYGDRLHPRIRGEITVRDYSQITRHPNANESRKYVDIHDYKMDPYKVEILVGGSVTWTNRDPAGTHTVTGAGFDSGNLRPEDSFTHTFTKKGIYPYSSTIHPSTRGEVVVVDYRKIS